MIGKLFSHVKSAKSAKFSETRPPCWSADGPPAKPKDPPFATSLRPPLVGWRVPSPPANGRRKFMKGTIDKSTASYSLHNLP